MISAAVVVFFSIAASSVRAQLPTNVCGFDCSQLICDETVPCTYGGNDGWMLLAKQYCYYATYLPVANDTCVADAQEAATILNASCIVGSLAASCALNGTVIDLTDALALCNGPDAPCLDPPDTNMCDGNEFRYNVGFGRFYMPEWLYSTLHGMDAQSICTTSTINGVPATCAQLADVWFRYPNNGAMLTQEVQVFYPTQSNTGAPVVTTDFYYTTQLHFQDGSALPLYPPPTIPGIKIFQNAIPASGGKTRFDGALLMGDLYAEPTVVVDMAMRLAASGRIVVVYEPGALATFPAYNGINSTSANASAQYQRFLGAPAIENLATAILPFTMNAAFSSVIASTQSGVAFSSIYSGAMTVITTGAGCPPALALGGMALITPGAIIWNTGNGLGYPAPYAFDTQTDQPGHSTFIVSFVRELLAIGNNPALWTPTNGVVTAHVPLFPYFTTLDWLVNGTSLTTPYALAAGSLRRFDITGIVQYDTIDYFPGYPAFWAFGYGITSTLVPNPISTFAAAYEVFQCDSVLLPSLLTFQPTFLYQGLTVSLDASVQPAIYFPPSAGYTSSQVGVFPFDPRIKVFLQLNQTTHESFQYSRCLPSYVAPANTSTMQWELSQMLTPPGQPVAPCGPPNTYNYEYGSLTNATYECIQVDTFNIKSVNYFNDWSASVNPVAERQPLNDAIGNYNLNVALSNFWAPGGLLYDINNVVGPVPGIGWCGNQPAALQNYQAILAAIFNFADYSARQCHGTQATTLYNLVHNSPPSLVVTGASCNLLIDGGSCTGSPGLCNVVFPTETTIGNCSLASELCIFNGLSGQSDWTPFTTPPNIIAQQRGL